MDFRLYSSLDMIRFLFHVTSQNYLILDKLRSDQIAKHLEFRIKTQNNSDLRCSNIFHHVVEPSDLIYLNLALHEKW